MSALVSLGALALSLAAQGAFTEEVTFTFTSSPATYEGPIDCTTGSCRIVCSEPTSGISRNVAACRSAPRSSRS